MDPSRTEKYIEEMINDMKETWGIPEGTAMRLLKKFDWIKDKALNSLTEECNLETMEIICEKQQEVMSLFLLCY